MKPDPRKSAALARIQRQIGHQFSDEALLRQALTHRSHAGLNNERLEFVGDSILNYTVARMLYDAFPKLPEGKLSRLRANLVNQNTLAALAGEMQLGEALYLGAGEMKSGGSSRPSILADAVEALFAAVCLDAGFATAEAVVRRLFAERVRGVDLDTQAKDAKSRLQEALQARRLPLPKYRIEKQTGEGSEAWFEVSCDLGELGHITRAEAASRRAAEQLCAAAALEWLQSRGKAA